MVTRSTGVTEHEYRGPIVLGILWSHPRLITFPHKVITNVLLFELVWRCTYF